MIDKKEAFESFKSFVEYLEKEGKIEGADDYKKDFSAFLVHARQLKAYDFVKKFCKDKKVLDIGCFLGYGEKIISNYAREVVAIDNDTKALEFAKFTHLFPNLKFLKTDARKLFFKDNSFDVILAFQLIEHIPPEEITRFLGEVKRVLKSGGIFFLTTPNKKIRLRLFQKPFNKEHYQEFTFRHLEQILRKFFPDTEIKGVRAEKWLEEIEKNRVKISFYNLYIAGFFAKVFPKSIKNFLKRIKLKITKNKKLPKSKKVLITNQFYELFYRFSMEDFYLEKQRKLIDKSLDLFAICKK